MKIGFIGLGIMGSRMAERLVDSGHDLRVHNRTRSKADRLVGKGAIFADTAADAAGGVEVLITMLASPETVSELAHGDQGFLSTLSPEAVWMDCSTVDPNFARELDLECRGRGLRYLESPVSGTRVHAQDGKIVFYVGGNQDDLDHVKPLMEVMGTKTIHLGLCGTAASLKLVLAHLVASSVVAFAEGAVLGEALGLDRDTLFELMAESPTVAPFLREDKEKMKDVEFETDFPLHLMVKDTSLVSLAAREVGISMPLANSVDDAYRMAEDRGLGREDYTAVYRSLKNEA